MKGTEEGITREEMVPAVEVLTIFGEDNGGMVFRWIKGKIN